MDKRGCIQRLRSNREVSEIVQMVCSKTRAAVIGNKLKGYWRWRLDNNRMIGIGGWERSCREWLELPSLGNRSSRNVHKRKTVYIHGCVWWDEGPITKYSLYILFLSIRIIYSSNSKQNLSLKYTISKIKHWLQLEEREK